MLAQLVRDLPTGAMTYEPKWDGFCCLAFVGPDGVDLRSRRDRPLARYFPEIVEGFETVLADRSGPLGATRFVVDGEILLAKNRPEAGDALDADVAGRSAPVAFAALMSRLHPAATRVERLRREIPARYVAFDLLAEGPVDLRDRPFVDRRAALVRLLPDRDGVITATPATRDVDVARRWLARTTPGIDGVAAEFDDLRYEPGRRSMIKIKRLRTDAEDDPRSVKSGRTNDEVAGRARRSAKRT